ncbi:type IV pilus assembly protein PilF [Natronospira proteinivora]|uniref:Type IV pilus assembly protein PilF n=1 Tax=Natronospira proteinivora TaxID=1807133 RepID=A0ABT1G7Q8_9GAMM|nr:type IV pilus biogenesis/stability protein PilW [Natronospira proteinivora]MCP1727329.1 type IV pilus assembly protein PilF [Natronospira proteinivora]
MMVYRNWAILVFLLLFLTACTGTPERDTEREEAASSHLQLGVHYMRQGNLSAAKDNLEKSLEFDDRNAMAHSTIALLYEQINESRLAQRHYRRALRLDGDNPSVSNNYGTFLCRQGEYREAEEQLVQAAQNRLYQTPEVAWANAGSCVRRIPDYEAAEEYFRNALRLRSDYQEALRQMASMQYEREEFLSARAFFQRLADQGELEASALLLGVRIEEALDDREQAERYANRLKSKYPDSDEKHRLAELGYD